MLLGPELCCSRRSFALSTASKPASGLTPSSWQARSADISSRPTSSLLALQSAHMSLIRASQPVLWLHSPDTSSNTASETIKRQMSLMSSLDRF